ncbi:MAG: TIGR00730 family Rossman fold protein [Clostridia bacterium]|nr:TIGR00730 family Rossman fold protein [Clostridia bacterium]
MKICIYGASSNIIDSVYIEGGEDLGRRLAKRGHAIVYGGGAEGMMGAVARGMSQENGEIIGIAPSFFKVDGVLYDKCTKFLYTDTMRDRKKMMEDLSDAFLVTPGGIGTYDEFFEILTLRQLCKHLKPIAIFDINGYFKPLIDMLEQTIKEKFMPDTNRKLYFVSDNPDDIIDYLENYKATETDISTLKHISK